MAYGKRREEDAAEAAARAGAGAEAGGDEGEGTAGLGVFVLDPILPGQMLDLNVFEPRYLEMVRRCLDDQPPLPGYLGNTSRPAEEEILGERGSRRFAMMTSVPTAGRYGTEVEIVGDTRENSVGNRMLVRVRGVRVFEVLDGHTDNYSGLWEASVRYVTDYDAGEVEGADERDGDGDGSDGPTAQELSRDLDDTLASWEAAVLAGGWERRHGQMDRVRTSLGPLPDHHRCAARALWAAALINPLPGLGVAREIRHHVLDATGDAREQLRIVTEAAEESRRLMVDKARFTRRVFWPVVLSVVVVAAAAIVAFLPPEERFRKTGQAAGVVTALFFFSGFCSL